MQKSKTETLIQKYLSHQLNEQELEELKLWIEEDASHREIFVKLLSLHHVNNQLNLLHQFDKEASWKSIQHRCNRSHTIHRRIAIYSSAAAIAILIGITSILYFNGQKPVPAIAQNEQPQQSPLPKNTETPKATWVQANHSVVPLYETNGKSMEVISTMEKSYFLKKVIPPTNPNWILNYYRIKL